MRRKAKRDANEPEIVDALRSIAGVTVDYLNDSNIPDLIVGFRGNNYLLEVKTAKGKLKTGQADWHRCWSGQVAVVRSIDEALVAIGAID